MYEGGFKARPSGAQNRKDKRKRDEAAAKNNQTLLQLLAKRAPAETQHFPSNSDSAVNISEKLSEDLQVRLPPLALNNTTAEDFNESSSHQPHEAPQFEIELDAGSSREITLHMSDHSDDLTGFPLIGNIIKTNI